MWRRPRLKAGGKLGQDERRKTDEAIDEGREGGWVFFTSCECFRLNETSFCAERSRGKWLCTEPMPGGGKTGLEVAPAVSDLL